MYTRIEFHTYFLAVHTMKHDLSPMRPATKLMESLNWTKQLEWCQSENHSGSCAEFLTGLFKNDYNEFLTEIKQLIVLFESQNWIQASSHIFHFWFTFCWILRHEIEPNECVSKCQIKRRQKFEEEFSTQWKSRTKECRSWSKREYRRD